MAGEIYFSNITGKFDWGSIVDQILRIKSLPLERMAQESAQIKAKQESLSKLANAVDAFNNLFSNLSVEDLFKQKSATSSNTDVLTATASADAPNVTLNVTVDQLSSKEIMLSRGGVRDLNDTITWNDFQLRYAKDDGDYETFSISAGSGKLEDLVRQINERAGSRIVASIFYDGTKYRLMLSEKNEADSRLETDPSTNTFVISEASAMNLNGTWGLDYGNPLQFAKNAQITIGSTTFSNPSNTLENVITGLTVELKNTGSATITIRDDYSKVKNFFSDFVNKYNAVVKQINEMTDKDKGLFQGDQIITGVKNSLANMLDPLFRYGIVSYNEDGTLTFNGSAVDELASNNPQELKRLIEGLKISYGTYLEQTRIDFQFFINDYQSSIDDINERMAKFQEQLIEEEQRLKREFSSVEVFINQAQEIMERMRIFIVSLSEMQGGKK
ncbi:flagellar filament capping protein FliD [Thermocrinis jamiesonii]|jgi:Flagellar capping protein|uniref:flagellar filament capping protein FliD n=1 Tax=Thermocrinis jamiesonii TaxID=1302351 RepID=UPI000495253F|nr:flagellar filament capping protein FliD [Thermocrinis jamiesonii]